MRLVGPDHREFGAAVVGPWMLRYSAPSRDRAGELRVGKIEAVCHICRHWATFEWTVEECRRKLEWHVRDAHSDRAKPRSNSRMPPPGR